MKLYSKMTKEELIAELKRQKPKKYGLLWEPHDEDVVEQCKTKLPVLNEVTKRAIEKAPGELTNIIIEGDNYHALSVLNYTHQGKIDVIYIDPPYNTGAKDWKYNNDYVDENDTYRHSKWLSMMEHRLKIAKNLLSENGVLVCTIDENEHATLGVSLRELFPNKEIVSVTIIHNPGGIQGKNFSYTHEYAYFIYPSTGTFISNVKRNDVPPTPLRDWGKESSMREAAKNCFYPIIIRDGVIVGFGDVSKEGYHPKLANTKGKDGTIEIYPIDRNGVERKWRYSRQSVEEIKGELICQKIKDEWVILRDKRDYRWKTVWTDAKYNANVYGTQLVNKIIDTKFPFPKSLYAVEDCIKAVIHNKDSAIILDFFAGSGTTGHAVMKLNQEDGGKRQFILCTNNENKIAEEVTYPRIKKVISGYANEKGIPANVRYFKTDFVEKNDVSDDTRRALVERSTDMICVRENTFESKFDNTAYKIFTNGKSVTGILFNLKKMEDFKKKIDTLKMPAHIYVFSVSNDAYEDDFEDLEVKHKIIPIPESILEVYRKLFKRL